MRTGGKGDLGNQVAARAAKNPAWFTKDKQARQRAQVAVGYRRGSREALTRRRAQRPGELTLTPVGAAGLAAALAKMRAAEEAAALDAYLALPPPAAPQQPAPPPPPAPKPQPYLRPPPPLQQPASPDGGGKRIKLGGDADAPSAALSPAATTRVGDGERLAVALLLGDTSRADGASRRTLDDADASLRAALAAVQRARDGAVR